MRFHYGAVPEDPHFSPEAEGWLAIREPGPWLLQLIALPVAVILLLLSGALLYLVFPRELLLNQSPPLTISIPIWPFLSILILIIPIHELIHAVCHPGWGFSSNSVIGLWLSRALFYAHYEGSMSRNRFLLIFAMPYIVLSLLPIPLLAVSGILGWTPDTALTLAYLSLIGGILACGDVVGFWLVISQIPGSAIVRNKGWKTYWRPGE
jgi:hypothetical protein